MIWSCDLGTANLWHGSLRFLLLWSSLMSSKSLSTRSRSIDSARKACFVCFLVARAGSPDSFSSASVCLTTECGHKLCSTPFECLGDVSKHIALCLSILFDFLRYVRLIRVFWWYWTLLCVSHISTCSIPSQLHVGEYQWRETYQRQSDDTQLNQATHNGTRSLLIPSWIWTDWKSKIRQKDYESCLLRNMHRGR